MLFQLLYIFISARIFLTVISASIQWNPHIHWTALPNGTAYISIEPLFPGAARYNVCIMHAVLCYGSVSEFEKHDNSIVFVVNKLIVQLSYDIWVMPLDIYGDYLLDEYRFHKHVTISPPVLAELEAVSELATETEATPTSGATDKPNTVNSHVTIAVATLLSVVVLGVLITVAFKKGYIQKENVRFPRVCCYRHQTVDILLLYIHKENSPFTSLVKAHSDHLNSYVSCNFVDTKDIRQNPNPSEWLASQMKNCHVLVYVSPLMRRYLLNEEPFSNNAYHTTVVETVKNLTSPGMLKGRTRKAFILPGCFDGDAEAARKLAKRFKLPCHLVVQQKKPGPDHEVELNSSCELLHQILGTRMCPCLTCFACVDSTATTEALLDAVQELSLDETLVRENQQSGELPVHLANPEQVPFLDASMSGLGFFSSPDSPYVSIGVDEPNEANYPYEDDKDKDSVSFIQPEDIRFSLGSQLSLENVEENLGRLNRKNDW